MSFDFQSATWHLLRRWAQDQLQRARERNDLSLEHFDTATLRGEIKVLKKFLDLPNQATRGSLDLPEDEDS